jgi:hypothetical protein
MRPVHRITPALPPALRKTFTLLTPVETHMRPATCEEIDCTAHANGWITRLNEAMEEQARLAHMIRYELRRQFVESRSPEGLTEFIFPPGQRCFRAHRVPLDREPICLVREGDYRGNPRQIEPVRHSSPAAWRDHLGEHLDTIRDAIQQG